MRFSCHITSNKMIKQSEVQTITDMLSDQFIIGLDIPMRSSSDNLSEYEMIITGDINYGMFNDMEVFVRSFASHLRSNGHVIEYRWY